MTWAMKDIRAVSPSSAVTVACVGVYILDILGRPISSLPVGQTSQLIDEIRISAAGTAGGTSVDLARLGAKVIAMGAVGQDEIGEMLVSLLDKNGVDTRYLVRKPEAQTSATILPIHPDGTRPAWHVIGANGHFGIEDVNWEAIAGCELVHLGGISAMPRFDGDASVEVLRFAKRRGALTTADCLGVKREDTLDLLRRYLPLVDVFMPNAQEAARVTGLDSPEAAADVFLQLGAGCVIVKLGERGCLIAHGATRTYQPAFDVPVVDSTGCGDAFCAGVIIGLSRGWSIDQAAQFGTAAAALTIQGLGSDAGLQSFEHTQAFAASARRKSC